MAKQSGTGKALKGARSTLLETLTLHRLEDEYYYIVGGEKGPPPKASDMVSMEVCSKVGAAASQGDEDTPLCHKHVSWEEQVRAEEEPASTEDPKKELPPPLQRGTASTSTPSMTPLTDDDRFTPVWGRKSRDKRPRDPSKDSTPRQRPSKASRSPLPFPLRSEAERVANVHTIFKTALNQTRPSSKWVYDSLEMTSPIDLRSSWYTSPMCCVSPLLSFTSPLDAPLWACVSQCYHRLWRQSCLHWRRTTMIKIWGCKMFTSSVRLLSSD